ncbi:conjugal transfer protein TraO, partial [Alistipes putredinis]
MKRFLFLLVASLALCVGQADAQRCLPKMRGVELKAGMADGFYSHSNRDDAGYCFGAALATYTKGGNKWVFGGEYLQRYNPYKESRIPTAQFTAEGGFYYNFLSDARKIFFVYIGGS